MFDNSHLFFPPHIFLFQIKYVWLSTNLDENSEEDNNDGGGDKHIFLLHHFLIDKEGQTERDATSQPSVGHDELVNARQPNYTPLVC